MKILVIGGTGKVGSSVVKELRKRDATVRALVRKKRMRLRLSMGWNSLRAIY